MKTILSALIGLAALASSASAQNIDAFTAVISDLAGNWSGVLEYRDYQSGQQVEIPHARNVRFAPDGSYMLTEMSYTDPNFQVYQSDVATFDGSMLLVASVSGGSIETSNSMLTEFSMTTTGWVIQFDGRGMDNEQPADMRYIIEFQGETLVQTQLVRADDASEFSVRNAVRLSRDD